MDINEYKFHLGLSALIKKCNHYYYNRSISIISDEEYDAIKRSIEQFLQRADRDQYDLGIIQNNIKSIGAPVGLGFAKLQHMTSMISLNNTTKRKDVEDFWRRIASVTNHNLEVCAELKVDGLSVSLIYTNGILYKGATRGDGRIGEDITENIMTVANIPKVIYAWKEIQRVEVRGEIFVTKSDFSDWSNKEESTQQRQLLFPDPDQQELQEKTNNQSDKSNFATKSFSNPRNFASGSLRLLDQKKVAKRPLRFIAYSLIGYPISTQIDLLSLLGRLGFLTDSMAKVCRSVDELMEFHDQINQSRDDIDFEIDGLVYKANDLRVNEVLGSTSIAPRYALAHKFSPKTSTATIKEIISNTGRTGIVTPVAIFLHPVEIGSVSIDRATLHNYAYVLEKKIKPGDIVVVERAGDVIPYVSKVYSADCGELVIPEKCESCESDLIWVNNIFLKCNNRSCRSIVLAQISHAVSKDALNIQGLGKKIIANLYDHGFIKDIADIFYLSNMREELSSLDGMGQKSTQNVLMAIENASFVKLDKFYFMLGIDHVGITTAESIVKRYPEINDLVPYIRSENGLIVLDNLITDATKVMNSGVIEERLAAIDGIGQAVIRSWIDYFSNTKTFDMLLKLSKKVGLVKSLSASTRIDGKRIAFTGTLKITRQYAKDLAGGAFISSSITNDLDYLVCGKNPTARKVALASEKNVKVISEEEFYDLCSASFDRR